MVTGMVTATALIVAAWLTDIAVGDPEWAPHPVRWMGRAISAGDQVMNRGTRSRARALVAGALLTIVVVGTSAGAAWLIIRGGGDHSRGDHARHPLTDR
jgi:adenosylcobinamide-phosphate synthase